MFFNITFLYLQSHFSDRVFRINRAGNDMDESVTNFSEKLPQDLSEGKPFYAGDCAVSSSAPCNRPA